MSQRSLEIARKMLAKGMDEASIMDMTGADGRGDKAAESGDVDYEYHHIIKGLYATCSSWHIDPCRFP